jgi:hypothetical protein
MAPQAGPPPASLPFLPLLFIATLLNLFSRPSVHQTIETFLLLFLFYLTPPLLSVGTYFVAFHAWRHLLRLSALRDQLTPIDPIPRWTHSVRQLLLLSPPRPKLGRPLPNSPRRSHSTPRPPCRMDR